MGNYHNWVIAIEWVFLLLMYLITVLDQSQRLYFLCLVYLFKLTCYFPINTSCSIPHEVHITDSFNKQCDIYIHEIIHKQKGCNTFISTYSQYAYIYHKHIIQDIHRHSLTLKPIWEKPQRRSSYGMRNMLAPFVYALSLQNIS